MRILIVLLASSLAAAPTQAQKALPPPVQTGLDSLAAGNCTGAFREWVRSWTGSPEDEQKRQSLLGSCAVLARLGRLHGYEVVRIVPIGENVIRYYAVLRYETQPVYLLLVAYRPNRQWRVSSVNWNTFVEKVFPPELLPPENPGP